MRSIVLFIPVIIFFASCSSTKKPTTLKNNTTAGITNTNAAQDGSSFDKAIVIQKKSEKAGVDAEYKWLAENYPGYKLINQSLSSKGSKHYDILKIKTKEGEEKDIYFDITGFFGKW